MFDRDLAAQFAEFGVPATWTPSGGGAAQVAEVIKRTRGADAIFEDFSARGRNIEISYRNTDFVGLAKNEIVVINGKSYKVMESPYDVDDELVKVAIGTFT